MYTSVTFFRLLSVMVFGILQSTCSMEYKKPIREDNAQTEFDKFDYFMWSLDNTSYLYNKRDGKGPLVFVFDTGITRDHPELKGNVIESYDFTGMTTRDLGGHGTHCSGTIAGTNTGVAPNAELVSVKVCDNRNCPYVDDALMWFMDTQKDRCLDRGCIISMSLGGGKRTAENLMINKISLTMNTIVVVAAGNEAMDACLKSPASSKYAITIGALDINGTFARFTNWGDCVDAYLPGVDIYSTYFDTYKELSGTSMATPLASGIIANIWSETPHAKAFEIKQMFLERTFEDTYERNMWQDLHGSVMNYDEKKLFDYAKDYLYTQGHFDTKFFHKFLKVAGVNTDDRVELITNLQFVIGDDITYILNDKDFMKTISEGLGFCDEFTKLFLGLFD